MAINHLHEAVRAVLLANTTVTAITTTIKPWILWRTDELPAITYNTISHAGNWSYEGALAWKSRRLQLDCWARGFDAAHGLAAAVVAAVDGYMNAQHGGVYLHRLRVDDVAEQPQDPEQGREQPPFAVRVDVIAAYELTS